MTVSEIIMIVAVVVSPIAAVQVSTFLERRRERRSRRLELFRTLMSTRAARMSQAHVQALNMIDVEFAGSDQASMVVVNAWKAYLDLLNDSASSPEVWSSRRDDFFVDLLHTMSQALGYTYDKTHIRRTSYYPRGFGDSDWDQLTIRRALREVLEGKRWIPVWTAIAPEQQKVSQQDIAPSDELSKPSGLSDPLSPKDTTDK